MRRHPRLRKDVYKRQVMMGYAVIKVFFGNLKRGGILLIQIAVGSLYMFSVPRGYIDGFTQWCKQAVSYTHLIDAAVVVFCVMFVIALGVRIFPVFITKIQLDHFADELVREAEISGRVGSETTARQRTLEEKTGIHPAVSWSGTGKIQLNEEVTVTLTLQKDLGLCGK